MPREYLIQDPATAYAVDFIRCMHRIFGWKAVCYYTADGSLPSDIKTVPELFDSTWVAASYRVDASGQSDFIQHLKNHHDIAAVVPYNEVSLSPAIDVAEALKLEWVQPEVMRRFRDKYTLKRFLHQQDPGLRLSFFEIVDSPENALFCARRAGLRNWVLKPNDGYGNYHVGFFSAESDLAAVRQFWASTGCASLLLESLLIGREFHCNGQVDAEGRIEIFDIGESIYERRPGVGAICCRTDQTRSNRAEFDAISRYTRRCIELSGLRRSPFHAEVILEDEGPSLIECAARIIGADCAYLTNRMHGQPFSIFDIAAHYYGTAAPYGDPHLDWQHYDGRSVCKVRGVARKGERIYTVSGLEEVESLPEFVTWYERPFVGQNLQTTASLFSSPYVVIVEADKPAKLPEIERRIRDAVHWNRPLPSAIKRAMLHARHKIIAAFRRLVSRRGRRALELAGSFS